MQDRRKYPRISSTFSLEVKPSPAGGGTSENVSKEGLLFTHNGEIPRGEILDLTLRVPWFTGSINVKGKVIRCDPTEPKGTYNVAINFVDADEDTQKSITGLINSF